LTCAVQDAEDDDYVAATIDGVRDDTWRTTDDQFSGVGYTTHPPQGWLFS